MFSRPAVVNYVSDNSGTLEVRKVAYFGTNQGFLHAIDANKDAIDTDKGKGKELWGFIPTSLLPNAHLQANGSRNDRPPYGMDGSPVVWIKNQDPQEEIGDANDQIILVTGMRRGGNQYFAFDITNPESPDFLWEIEGGTGDFATLGQTWSTPTIARVKTAADEAPKTVLIYGGGYDPDTQDEATAREADSIGNDIFIVDIEDGSLLWKASAHSSDIEDSDKMDFSIPAQVTAIDPNSDGLTDQFYAVDVGGQVWRFDIDNSHVNGFIRGGRIADFAGGSTTDHRRFFSRPDVSLTIKNNKYRLAIAFGSGAWAAPTGTAVDDRFYVLLQDAVFAPPVDYEYQKLNHGDLTDRTTDLTGATSAHGWFIKLPGNGEKVLTPSITLANTVIFSTFTPPPAGSDCESSATGNIWSVNLLNGTAPVNSNGAAIDRVRSSDYKLGALAQPQLFYTEDGPVLLSGTERLFIGNDFGLRPHTWSPQIWRKD